MKTIAFKQEMARFVAANLARFVSAAERIDAEYSVAAYRSRRANQLRAARGGISRAVQRGKLREWVVEEEDSNFELGLKFRFIRIPSHEAPQLDILDFPYRRDLPATAHQRFWHLRTHGLSDRVQLESPNASRNGRMKSWPLWRLADALRWARELDMDLSLEEAKCALLLFWLLEQRNAYELLPGVCEFQRL